MVASVHGYSQSVLVSVCISRQSPKRTLLATPAAYSSRVNHEIQKNRAVARRHWTLVWRWAFRNCQLVTETPAAELSIATAAQNQDARSSIIACSIASARIVPSVEVAPCSVLQQWQQPRPVLLRTSPAANLSVLLPSIVPK
jgi:hypothetical protein